MSRPFEIRREVELDATPEAAWAALTTAAGQASWLFPGGDAEPRVGGSAWGGHVVTAWEPGSRYGVRAEGPDGWFNALEHELEALDGGRVRLRYAHSGVFADDWDSQLDAAGVHTDFYLHTLGEYLRRFAPRGAAYASAMGPAATAAPDALARVAALIGVGEAAVGEAVRVEVPGLPTAAAVVDYRTASFLGLRTDDALLRLFARGTWGHPLQAAHHLFAPDADAAAVGTAWGRLLESA